MKFQRVALLFVVVFMLFALSACGTRTTTQNFPGLVVQDELVYLSEGSHVYLVNSSNGQEARLGGAPLRFPKEADGNTSLFAPIALTVDGQMIVPNSHPSQHSLFSADPQTGNTSWAFEKSKGTWVAGALTLGETIYASGGDGILYALDLKGNQRWSVSISKNALLSHAVTDGTLIFQATMDGVLYALDASTGNEIWQADLSDPIISSPALHEAGRLYVGTLGGEMFALEAGTGTVIWKQKLEGSIWSAPALSEDTVYTGTLLAKQGKFYALQRDTGAIRWQRDEASSIIASPLAMEAQVVYVTDAGRVQALSSDNAPLWQADLKGKLVSAPVLAGNTILVAPLQGDAMLVAFDVNGAQRWTFLPEK
ncbi:MAG: PQQ-binding-like beta-propeller repeat protein [Anaerolineales bacterium]|jgi:outer membrane protein assembly factor BamB|nr:PQQ-binding-like beta-propeller repeat protein [Anaerolineales bacterium]